MIIVLQRKAAVPASYRKAHLRLGYCQGRYDNSLAAKIPLKVQQCSWISFLQKNMLGLFHFLNAVSFYVLPRTFTPCANMCRSFCFYIL